ncbi:MAG TPA: rhomboid family intramembrane serine protease [Solirubrobacteraceae bacterium]|jgi:membrane associated rhomboid family serine protease
MASGPDLFVVCKSCGSEVSPYITECPYCGTRLRKRAPKLEKGGVPKPVKPRRRPPTPSLGRLRPGEIPGIRADISRRPYATIALVLAGILTTLVLTVGVDEFRVVWAAGFPEDPWRLLTTSFYYIGTGYELVALAAIALFGWLLERRHGAWAPLLVYVAGAVAGSALERALDPESFYALGGNGAALALLCAWVVPELLARRRHEETEADLLGVAAIAALLLALPLATEQASGWAGLAGAVVGLVLGLALSRVRRR